MSRFTIIANGPFLDHAIIIEAIQHRIIIALDGAADKLLALHIKPDIILGDFDSIHPKTKQYWGIIDTLSTPINAIQSYQGQHGVTIIAANDQSETDLVKAIRYCDQQKATDIHIICASYGREDLHAASHLALQTEYRHHRPIIIHGEQQSVRWAENETISFHGKLGDYCGFRADHSGYCDSTGLRYPCKQIKISVCNTLSQPTAQIKVTGGALLWLPPQLKSQRTFMMMTETSRLKNQWMQSERISKYFK